MTEPKTVYAKDILDIINKNLGSRYYPSRDSLEYFVMEKFRELCNQAAEYINHECQSIDELKKYIPEKNIRAIRCLHNEKIKYMEELVYLSANDLLKTPNFGIKSLATIRDAWLKSGHSIKEYPEQVYRNGYRTITLFDFVW